ncbi:MULTISPECIES: TetR/AcrR family transcriptional regulator [Mycobacteriaceae]|uniref:TetR/AcrR family transcriptional regulator n=1 Tax=Mycobacteriaceae TaxID=1762 RepID=UPI0007FCEBA4|nr:MULTISPECIES: TetR/AcrR family transcriptional regulator [Mycobacteriaceae]MCK0177037.1 TetR/AcrR family transcriptional regulator [Mycolicibacterium sp. F2034L]OBB57674.1 TetR family transcriptional regulator [Mycobacterium sp. 852013-51886_SCH5428379]
MGGAISREAYFDTGLAVLSDQGYGGLKLAEVCQRLGVTTGSFYHYFSNWSTYTRELVEYWRHQAVTKIVEAVRTFSDPHRRVEVLIEEALALPHGAEAAIRVWSSIDSDVYAVQAEVDRQRYDIVRESSLQILGDQRQAEVFAAWCVYTLVGYEQATIPRDHAAVSWIAAEIIHALDSGRFKSLSDGS